MIKVEGCHASIMVTRGSVIILVECSGVIWPYNPVQSIKLKISVFWDQPMFFSYKSQISCSTEEIPRINTDRYRYSQDQLLSQLPEGHEYSPEHSLLPDILH